TFNDPGQNAMAVSGQAFTGTNRQIERAVGPDDMCAVGSQERVVRSLVSWIRECATAESVYTQILTPGVRRLEIEASDVFHVCQRLQGVIVGMSAIGEKRHGAGAASDGNTELGIRQNEILRVFVESEHRTVDAGRYRRQTLVARTGECAVIELGYLSRQGRVVSVREVGPQRGAVSQMQCAGLSNAIDGRTANRSKSGAGDVNA